MNRDSFYCMPLNTVVPKAYEFIDHGQDWPPEQLFAALGFTFLVVCQETDTDARRMLEVIDRVIRDADEHQLHQLKALREYVRGEMQ